MCFVLYLEYKNASSLSVRGTNSIFRKGKNHFRIRYLEATLLLDSLNSSISALLCVLIFVCDCFTVPALLPPSRNVTVVVVSVPLLLPSDSKMMVSLRNKTMKRRVNLRRSTQKATLA